MAQAAPKPTMQVLDQYSNIQAIIKQAGQQQERLLDLCVQVQQIPAPTFAETARANWVAHYFTQLGLADVVQDESNNVYARIPGQSTGQSPEQSPEQSTGPALMVSAHTDTVFPADTDLTVRADAKQKRLYGPAIGDNCVGVAGLLLLAEQLHTQQLHTQPLPVDLWLVANSGEEGLGDLYGMRAAVDRLQGQIGACIVLEGMGLGRVVHKGLGSRRFRITATAPGGHSWSDFGTASAIHVLTQLAADLTQLKPSKQPRAAFNIGRMEGGRSVNTIADHAWLELDLRGETPDTLNALIQATEAIVHAYQTAVWQEQGVQVTIDTIGDRPTGQIAEDHPLVCAAEEALACSGIRQRKHLRMSSTDANIPLSRGIPAVCVGITEGGDAHRLTEWINTELVTRGMQHLLMLTVWSALWLGDKLD